MKKIILTGSLGNISKRLTEKLVEKGHHVTVVSHSPTRTREIEALQAKAAIGSVEDVHFLTKVFEGADAVYTMVPPNFDAPDYKEFTKKVTQNYAQAIEQNQIRYVVNLSSVGSALSGMGPLIEYQNLEESIDKLTGVNVMHLRPGGFYYNFYGSMALIKHQGFMGNNFADTVKMVMSHPYDIADAAFEALNNLLFKGKNVRYIVSDEINGKEAAQMLGAAIGKPDLQWVHFSDQQLLEGLMQNGFSKHTAQHYIVDMGIAIREGLLEKHYQQNKHEVFGKITFNEFAREFAFVYNQNYLQPEEALSETDQIGS
jgi:uncharacterized protein YbjT (DUF2867 family)